MSEPITAWRYWRLDSRLNRVGDNLYSYEWFLAGDVEKWEGPLKQAGTHRPAPTDVLTHMFLRNMGARPEPLDAHKSPFAGCVCGVNSVKRLRTTDFHLRAGSPFYARCIAFGQVDLGGRVDEYEEGYRAEYARIAGPIYFINPPEKDDGWREAIERRYGQPVIVQEFSEALDWIRKDEEAHGHRQAHQDARTGATGGPSATATGALTFSLGTRAGYVTLADPATRKGGRARSRLSRFDDWFDRHFAAILGVAVVLALVVSYIIERVRS